MNYGYWAIGFIVLALLLAAYLIHRQRSAPARFTSAKASAVNAVVQGLRPHIEAALSSAKDQTEAAVSALRAELKKSPATPAQTLNEMAGDTAAQFGAPVQQADGMLTISKLDPAAPVASVAVPPPSAAPAVGPSAGSGGTVITPEAAHAALDAAIIAHQAAIKTALAQKDAITAAQATLAQATAAVAA